MQQTRLWAGLIAVAFILAVTPTLNWLEFSSGAENLLVSTVIEMRSGGEKLVPTLNGQPRIRKPPLAAWMTDLLLPQSLIDSIERAPPGPERDRAFQRLAFALRLPVVLMSAGIVLLVFEIGRSLRDEPLGLTAAAVAASSLMLLRYGRSASTDIHLAFWVTLGDFALIKWLGGARPMRWLMLAAAAMGLAFLSKGPVGLLFCVAPVALYAVIAWRRGDAPKLPASTLVTSVLIFLAIAAPWFGYVALTTPNVWHTWWSEISRQGATALKSDPWFAHATISLLLAPWTVLMVGGLFVCAGHRRRDIDGALPLIMLLLPLVALSLVKDKNERYLLPLIAPASIIAAQAAVRLLKPAASIDRNDRFAAAAHWMLVFALAIGVPVSGAIAAIQPDRTAWWNVYVAAAVALLVLIACVMAIMLWRQRPVMLLVTTAMLMFTVHTLFLQGYRHSLSGRSEMKPIADAIAPLRPAKVLFFDTKVPPKPLPQDLQIYLNRVVQFVSDPAELGPPSSDTVIVVQRRENLPEPRPAGWTQIAIAPWGKRAWIAFSGQPK